MYKNLYGINVKFFNFLIIEMRCYVNFKEIYLIERDVGIFLK